MTRRLALVTLVGLASLAGCPSNEFDYRTWTAKLDNPREAERAARRLEELGNPDAIPAIGEAWVDNGKPGGFLQVIIALARPLTAQEAEKKFMDDYKTSGRKASWDAALPFLKQALLEVDPANPHSVDSAAKAADALAEAKLPGGLEALVDLAQKPATKQLVEAQTRAVRALGQYEDNKAAAVTTLIKLIDREPPAHPRTAADTERAAAAEKYTLFIKMTGAAVLALGDLRAPQAAKPLVIAMYRVTPLFAQIRRALVASGPSAKDELRKILSGQHPDVERLFQQKQYKYYCGDKGDTPENDCQEVSLKDAYAAIVLGDFFDPATVPDLLAVLKRPSRPAFYEDEQPLPLTQHKAVFEALGKIGSPAAAKDLYALWKGVKAPKKGDNGPPDFESKLLAIRTYPYVATESTGLDELAAIAADNGGDRNANYHDPLRQASAEAFARMSRDPKGISILQGLATKYATESTKKRKEADGKKADKAAADKVYAEQRKAVDQAKLQLQKIANDKTQDAATIRAETNKVKDAESQLAEHKKKHRKAIAPYQQLDDQAKAYHGFSRMFEEHIARIQTGIRCKDDLKCYADTLKMKPEDTKQYLKAYISDIDTYTKEEQLGLLEGNIERAMLEIGKQGQKASKYTEDLLDAVKSDNRIIRQSIQLALPKIAAIPCANCEAKLDAAIKAGEGKVALKELQIETTMMRNYFSWAGGKTPAKTPPPAEKP